jgi:asparagine synthase (glutamine-hydrolysing)
MCGITMVMARNGQLEGADRDAVVRMTSVLKHRGPDDWGVHFGGNYALGSTRLRVNDLSAAGDMPMSSEDGAVILTYNGEITNFRELAAEFRLSQQVPLRSSSDTEVLLRLYELLGIDFVQHLSGYFAFCLVDRVRQKAFVVRDQFGARPVFYRVDSDRLHVASELKSFFEVPGFSPELDAVAFNHYFSLAYIPGEHTPYTEVRELDGGHYLECDLETGELTTQEYYEIEYPVDDSLDERGFIAATREAIIDTVRRNYVSDKPVGIMLSGGLDSTGILGVAKHLGLARQTHTFSIKVEEASFDESRYQRAAVEYAKPIHHEISFGADEVMSAVERHMAFMDEPLGDGASLPFFLLAGEAAKHVTVLLSGEGGDEVFNAYETHGAYKARRAYRGLVPSPVRRLIRGGAAKLPTNYSKLSFDFLAKRFSEGAELDVPRAHHFWREAMNVAEKAALLQRPEWSTDTSDLFARAFEECAVGDELDRLSRIDWKYFYVGDLMVKGDRTLMAHSLEPRYPYADRVLFDLVRTIPSSLRLKGFRRRHIQRQAMKDFLPPLIYRRTNMGLELPHSLWFGRGLRPLVEEYLSPKSIDATDFLRSEAVTTMLAEHEGGVKDHGRSLWCILNFVVWHRMFIQTRDYRKYLDTWQGDPRITRDAQ